MITGRLLTRTGEFVTEFVMPPFQLLPEVAIWGSRIFARHREAFEQCAQPADPVYYEACAWSVDASKAVFGEAGTLDPLTPDQRKIVDEFGQTMKEKVIPEIVAAVEAHNPNPLWPKKPKATISGEPPADGMWEASAPQPVNPESAQHRDYWVLPDAELAKGFVRPVRSEYKHGRCGVVTSMGRKLSETYARDPKYYGLTFCVQCREHLPVAEFTWVPDGTVVGS